MARCKSIFILLLFYSCGVKTLPVSKKVTLRDPLERFLAPKSRKVPNKAEDKKDEGLTDGPQDVEEIEKEENSQEQEQ